MTSLRAALFRHAGNAASGALRFGLAVVLLMASTSAALAQRESTSAAQSAPQVVVLVLDLGEHRLDVAALSAALTAALERPVVRITDERARDAAGTLTVAADAEHRWLVRYDARGRHATRTSLIARPGLVVARVAEIAAVVVAELDAPATRRPPAEYAYLLWDDEILDPFVGLPRPARREVAIVSEVLDPFAPLATRRRDPWAEVIDPWRGETP